MVLETRLNSDYKLKILFFTPYEDISLDLLSSDHISNLAIVEQLIGTLVKYGNNGLYEPFLANSWNSSNDFLKWNFKLNKNLTDQNGEIINAYSYIESLKNSIKYLSSHLGKTALDSLIDIEKIKTGDANQYGLIAKSEFEIQFNFKERPNGLIQHLAQPYYGFLSNNNYDNNGNWLNKKSIISSGQYEIKQWKNDKTVILKKRDIASNNNQSPSEVYFSLAKDKSDIDIEDTYTIYFNSVEAEDYLESFNSLITTPELLLSFSLGFGRAEVLKSKEERVLFKKKFTFYIHENFIMNKNSFPVTKFFELESKIEPKIEEQINYNGEFVVALSNSYPQKYEKILKNAIKYALPNAQVKIQRYRRDDKNEIAKILSNNYYQMRPTTVNTSSGYENWIIDMMFCTKLGISFPDPQGTICELVRSIHSGKVLESDGAILLNDIIEKEAYIIPVFREGTRFHFTNDLDIDSQSPTVALLRFDLIHRK